MIHSAWISPSGKIIKCGFAEHIRCAYEIITGKDAERLDTRKLTVNYEKMLEDSGWIKVSNKKVLFQTCTQEQLNVLYGNVDDCYIKEMIQYLDGK